MAKVAIVADSISCVPEEIAGQYDIKIVPYHVYPDDKHMLARVEVAPEFYRWQRETKKFAQTGAATREEFLQAFQEVSERAEAILCLVCSTGFTYAYERAASLKEEEELKVPLEVINTYAAMGGEGLIVLAAAKTAKEGKELAKVNERAEEVRLKMNSILMVDSLYYLERGGRIGDAGTLGGSRLSVKPILQVNPAQKGIFEPLERARTKSQALARLEAIMRERVKGKGKLYVWINDGDMKEEAEKIKERVMADFDCAELYTSFVDPLSASHLGPCVWLSFHED